MGKVLAMKPGIGLLLLCGFLAACGSAADNSIWGLAKGAAKSVGKSAEPVPLEKQRADLIAQAAAIPGTAPILMVELPQRGAVATMVVAGTNAGDTTWFDATGVAVITRNGVARATRGLATDLMSSDVSGTLRALRGGASRYSRFHRYLDGAGQAQDITFSCEMTRDGGAFSETCRVPEGRFTNTYELRGGVVVRSRQWLGRDIGYARLTRLR